MSDFEKEFKNGIAEGLDALKAFYELMDVEEYEGLMACFLSNSVAFLKITRGDDFVRRYFDRCLANDYGADIEEYLNE